MNELTMTGDGITMTSLEFLNDIINPARISAGESPVENRHFVSRIEDEIDDLGVTETIYATTSQGAKREVKGYQLNFDQMTLVGMRESKAVRRSVLAKLKELVRENKEPRIHHGSDDLRRIAEAKAMGLMSEDQAYKAAREVIGLSVEPIKQIPAIEPVPVAAHYDDYDGELISAATLEYHANVVAGSASKMMLKHGLARNVKLGHSGKRRISRLVLTSTGRKIAVQDGTKFIRFKEEPAIRWLKSVAPQLRY